MKPESRSTPAPQSRTLFGQPPGLAVLFLTELWERFTYYGMRAILILFLVGSGKAGGLGLDDKAASAIYGLYIAATYVFSLFGGWIADRLIGPQRAVISGALCILGGNALLTAGSVPLFFVGLLIIVLGVGLLKPNISILVGQLYPEGGARRDAGFTVFYMGISVGALLGSLLIPVCAARYGWRVGFALPAVGMLFGLAQFLLTRRWLEAPMLTVARRSGVRAWLPVLLFVLGVAALVGLVLNGRWRVDPVRMAAGATWVMAAVAAGYFLYLLTLAGLVPAERRRVYVMMALFAAYATFYAGFEQGGASLNLFAERYTDRDAFGWHMPAGVLQGTTALITILFAPLFAALWSFLGRRGQDLSPPAKFSLGLALLSAGFLVMFVAAQFVAGGERVLPVWLILTYFLQECGDLCLSPVGLSSMTKLAPARLGGQVMGLWFLALALGNNVAGQLSIEYDAADLSSLPRLFIKIFWWGLIAAIVMLLLTPVLKRCMAGVK